MHSQRNAYHHYLLNNNFKFYISQFFRAVNFLSAVLGFAKISSLIKNSFGKNSLSLRGFAKNRSNPNLIKFDFYNLISLINKFYTKWIASSDAFAIIKNKFAILITRWLQPLVLTIQRKAFLYNCTQWVKTHCYKKNKFEIISQLNYGFCYKNYFFNLNQVFRNSYDFGGSFGRNLNYGFGKNYFGNCNFGFDFGNEIYGIGNSLAGFLFNRKIKQKIKK